MASNSIQEIVLTAQTLRKKGMRKESKKEENGDVFQKYKE